jgi:hypothetical protein
MTDTTIIDMPPAGVQAGVCTPFSWSAAIAGAIAAAAITFIIAALGCGIGLPFTSVELAKIMFFVAIVLFLITAVFGAVGGRRPLV